MAKTKVFLSLAHVDASFVRAVHARLPVGLAHFYEQSFENGENLLTAMERAVADSALFVFFASPASLESYGVRFELDRARLEHARRPGHRILVFPTDPTVTFAKLPAWLREAWVAKAGWSPSDIARYITTILLEPDVGMLAGAIRVVGRGKSLDHLERLTADYLARRHAMPRTYAIAGFTGMGRRTFSTYYLRRALSAKPDLVYGPTLLLPAQAELVDIYKALRIEIEPRASTAGLVSDFDAFNQLDANDQVGEVHRLTKHFSQLGQAVTLVSGSGFFEDRGNPKSWVQPLIERVPSDAILVLISNRQFPSEFSESCDGFLQLRLEELEERDIKALMVFTADRLGVKNFTVSDQIARAIGGHADVANAAVRLAALKGTHILERDPHQLLNVQNTILGENVEEGALSPTQKRIMNILSWVPSLQGELLETVVRHDPPTTPEEFVEALESLILGCLVIANGSSYRISPSIRQLFRRWHPTPGELLARFAKVLQSAWDNAQDNDGTRLDLLEAFIFMHALEGKALPPELLPLLSPGTLSDVVKEAFARGKDGDDVEELQRVVTWGDIAHDMRMSEATREEIMSTVARAHIRLEEYSKAEQLITEMGQRGYRSILFLKGHMLRRREDYLGAIPLLQEAVREKKYVRSAIHELALSYKRAGQLDKLRKLLATHGKYVADSAMLVDFQIGVDLARGDLPAAEAGIAKLRRMADDDGNSDVRQAQLLMRRHQYAQAKELLGRLLAEQRKNRFRIRSLRAITAAKGHDFILAKQDIDFVRGLPGRKNAVLRLEATLLAEQGKLDDAQSKLESIPAWTPEDWLQQARVFELRSELAETGLAERKELKKKAAEIRDNRNFSSEFDFEG